MMSVSHVLSRGLAVLCLLCLLPAAATAEEKKGLAGMFRASTKAPTTIETGPLARACDVRGKALGKVVEKGPGKWKLYDTAPGSMAAREFYLTGFSDGCPRRITGAVAMFGSVELYELVHYGPVGMKPAGTETDRAYARMRAGVCGSSSGACRARGVKSLEKSAVFVSVYPSAAGSSRYELLMNRGKLAAMSLK